MLWGEAYPKQALDSRVCGGTERFADSLYQNKKFFFLIYDYWAVFSANGCFHKLNQSLEKNEPCAKSLFPRVPKLWISPLSEARCLFDTGCAQLSGGVYQQGFHAPGRATKGLK
ncbi:hypothetical protein [Methylomagnum sp.]